MGSGLLSINEAAKAVGGITGGRSPHQSCIRRWILRGARGHKLAATLVGGRYFVSRIDLIKFLNAPPAPPDRPSQSAAAISGILGKPWGNQPNTVCPNPRAAANAPEPGGQAVNTTREAAAG